MNHQMFFTIVACGLVLWTMIHVLIVFLMNVYWATHDIERLQYTIEHKHDPVVRVRVWVLFIGFVGAAWLCAGWLR